MKRFSTIIRRDRAAPNGNGNGNGNSNCNGNGNGTGTGPSRNAHGGGARESPEDVAARNVRLFCEAASPAKAGDEILYLPPIVDAAESSPAAAASAANQIRKFLARDHYTRPHVQYNAVMLLRILADNPGPSFTRNLDERFRDNLKWLLRASRDPSVLQITRETLDYFVLEKEYDDNLKAVIAMWKKERGPGWQPRPLPPNGQMAAYGYGGPPANNAYPRYTNPPVARGPSPIPAHLVAPNSLPPPEELVGRVEEARTSANLLVQLCSSTPASEVTTNELVSEFASRCQIAQQSLTGYMNATDPPPDEDTLQTLIETVEQLSVATSRHQRAVLAARRGAGFAAGFNAPDQTLGVASAGRAKPSAMPPSASAQPFNRPPPPPPTTATAPRPSVPLPPAAMRQQLSAREEGGVTPVSRALYPATSPSATSPPSNPFADDQEDHDLAPSGFDHHNSRDATPAVPSFVDPIPSPPQRLQRLSYQPAEPTLPILEDETGIDEPQSTPPPPRASGKGKMPLGRSPPTVPRPTAEPTQRLDPQQRGDEDEYNSLYSAPTPVVYEPPTPIVASPTNASAYPAYSSPFYLNTVPSGEARTTGRLNVAGQAQMVLTAMAAGESDRDLWSAQRKHWSTLANASATSAQPQAQAQSQPPPQQQQQQTRQTEGRGHGQGQSNRYTTITTYSYATDTPSSPPRATTTSTATYANDPVPAPVPLPRTQYAELEAPSSPPRPARSAPPAPVPFTATPSYTRRQDIAANGLVMSGGVASS